ncbi:MAG: hypothetical protein HY940_06795 [Gammaproteobacteria bacterium]|nr:hypothetical protein [Gammaproteobacteria bacterium]
MLLDCGCPGEYPDWHRQDIDLGNQCAHTLPIPMLLSMPLAYTVYLQRQQHNIDQLELKERWPGLVLTRSGLFRGSLTRLLEDSQSMSRFVRYLPAPFQVHGLLHHGNVSTSAKPIRAIQQQLLDSGRMPHELYLCHLTCPRCSPQRGGDQILLLRRWSAHARLQRRAGR